MGAGEDLAVFRLPVSLRTVKGHPAERSLYLGGADGCIFEVIVSESKFAERGTSILSLELTATPCQKGYQAATVSRQVTIGVIRYKVHFVAFMISAGVSEAGARRGYCGRAWCSLSAADFTSIPCG